MVGCFIPTDILFEVLLRLSVKTLSRFRCVCKDWCAMISDPYFRQLHDHRSEQHPCLLLKSDSPVLNSVQLHSVEIEDGVVQWHTIKKMCSLAITTYQNSFLTSVSSKSLGLICLDGVNEVLYMCNPSTGELVTIQKTRPDEDLCDAVGVGWYTGVGSAKKYKVVRFSHDFSGDDRRCEVWDIGSDHWRRVKEDPPIPLRGFNTPFVNGALHCLADSAFVDSPDHPLMASFDIETEKFHEFTFPSVLINPVHGPVYRCGMELAEFDGKIYLMVLAPKDLRQISIWMLEDYNNRVWVKLFTIDLTSLKGYYFIDPLILVMVEAGRRRILMQMLYPMKLFYYDIESKSFSEVDVGLQYGSQVECCLFVESLLLT